MNKFLSLLFYAVRIAMKVESKICLIRNHKISSIQLLFQMVMIKYLNQIMIIQHLNIMRIAIRSNNYILIGKVISNLIFLLPVIGNYSSMNKFFMFVILCSNDSNENGKQNLSDIQSQNIEDTIPQPNGDDEILKSDSDDTTPQH